MTYSSEVLADSPLVFWKFDETSGTTINDSSGNSRAGAYNGTPTLAATGLVQDGGTAVTLNGSSQWGQVANAAWMNSLTAVTIEIVVKTSATSGSIVARAVSTGPYRLAVSSGKVLFIVDTSIGTVLNLAGTSNINDNVTHHIVATWDGANSTVYVDGVQESTGAKGGTLTASATALRVGQRLTDSFFAGTVDCFAMYGTALSSTRVGVHAAAVSGGGVTGTLATTLAGATLAGSGAETFTGTFAATLASSTLAGSGTVANPVTGTLATTLAGATLAGTGTETFTGTFAATLGGATLAATGSTAAPVTGTLATTFSGATLTASGVEKFTGTLAVTLDNATVVGAGLVANPITGTLTVTLDDATLTGTGSTAQNITGTLAATLADVILAATGNTHPPFRDIKVLAVVDVSRTITPIDVSRNPAPVESPRPLTITEEVYA